MWSGGEGESDVPQLSWQKRKGILEWLWLFKVVGPVFSKTGSPLCLCFRTPIQNVIEGGSKKIIQRSKSQGMEKYNRS